MMEPAYVNESFYSTLPCVPKEFGDSSLAVQGTYWVCKGHPSWGFELEKSVPKQLVDNDLQIENRMVDNRDGELDRDCWYFRIPAISTQPIITMKDLVEIKRGSSPPPH